MPKLFAVLLVSVVFSVASMRTVAQTATQAGANSSEPAPIVRSTPGGDEQASQQEPRDFRNNDRTGPMRYPEYAYAGGPYAWGYAPYPYGFGYPYAVGYPFALGLGFGYYGYPGYYRGFGYGGPYRYGYGFRGPYGFGGGFRGGYSGVRRR